MHYTKLQSWATHPLTFNKISSFAWFLIVWSNIIHFIFFLYKNFILITCRFTPTCSFIRVYLFCFNRVIQDVFSGYDNSGMHVSPFNKKHGKLSLRDRRNRMKYRQMQYVLMCIERQILYEGRSWCNAMSFQISH